MQTLTLVRGVPEPGKSTLANSMLVYAALMYKPTKHFEADQFFEDDEGNYNFDPSQLGKAHADCRYKTENALVNGFNVIVANTFATLKEVRPYHEIAQRVGCNFEIVEATGNFKSIHGVPEEAMVRMRERYQPTEQILQGL